MPQKTGVSFYHLVMFAWNSHLSRPVGKIPKLETQWFCGMPGDRELRLLGSKVLTAPVQPAAFLNHDIPDANISLDMSAGMDREHLRCRERSFQ